MLKKVLIPLCLLAIVVILSGCQLPGAGPPEVTGDGIAIRTFEFDYSPIYSDEDTSLTLEIQNIGGEKGGVKKITLFGPDMQGSCPATGLTWCTGDGLTQTFDPPEELLPPDEDAGLEGEMDYYSWGLTPPPQVKTPITSTFNVRVDYSYKTIFTGTLALYKEDYWDSLSAEERAELRAAGGVIDTDTTDGPFEVTTASGRHFVIKETTTGDKTIKFVIQNIGSGFPYTGDDITDETRYTINIPDASLIGLESCEGNPPTPVKLSKGITTVVDCTFRPGDVTFTNKIDKQIQITLEYNYYTDDEATITVNPVFE